MDVDKSSAPPRSPKPKRAVSAPSPVLLPEVETYIHLLVLLYLIDQKKFSLVSGVVIVASTTRAIFCYCMNLG